MFTEFGGEIEEESDNGGSGKVCYVLHFLITVS